MLKTATGLTVQGIRILVLILGGGFLFNSSWAAKHVVHHPAPHHPKTQPHVQVIQLPPQYPGWPPEPACPAGFRRNRIEGGTWTNCLNFDSYVMIQNHAPLPNPERVRQDDCKKFVYESNGAKMDIDFHQDSIKKRKAAFMPWIQGDLKNMTGAGCTYKISVDSSNGFFKGIEVFGKNGGVAPASCKSYEKSALDSIASLYSDKSNRYEIDQIDYKSKRLKEIASLRAKLHCP